MKDWDKRVEEAADKFVFECPKYSGYPEHIKTFTAGANWAREELDKQDQLDEQHHETIMAEENDALRQQCEALAEEHKRCWQSEHTKKVDAQYDRDTLQEKLDRAKNALKDIDLALRIPAAEYVPAIGEVFTIIDNFLRYIEETSK